MIDWVACFGRLGGGHAIGVSLRVAMVGVFAVVLAVGAQAQPTSLRQNSIPPLPDSLRLYRTTLATRPALPTFAPPADALRLTLDEAIAIAVARNPDQAISALEAARARNDVTRGNAGFLPTLDASAGLVGSRSGAFFSGTDSTGASTGSVRSSTVLDASIGLGYTLFDGGLREATYRRLQADARRLALLADADAEALALDVSIAYLDAARLADLADAFAEAVVVSEDRLRLAQAEVRIGTAADIDAALALADYNADRAALLRQQVQLTGARAALGGLLALPDPEAVVATDSLSLGPPSDLGALVAEATDGSRRIRSAEVAEEIAALGIRQVRSEYRPTVRATAGVGLAALDTGFLPPDADPVIGPDLRYGVTAAIPLLDGGERRRRLQNAEIALRQSELATDALRVSARARAAQLAATARGFRGLVELETLNETIARENVRVALAQLRLGFISAVDLRQIQLALVDVRVRRVEAVYQARLAEAELRLLAGDLLPEDSLPRTSVY